MSKTIKISDRHERYAVHCDNFDCMDVFMTLNYYFEPSVDHESGELWPMAIQHFKFCPMCGKPITPAVSE
jgi:hypothetical protein